MEGAQGTLSVFGHIPMSFSEGLPKVHSSSADLYRLGEHPLHVVVTLRIYGFWQSIAKCALLYYKGGGKVRRGNC